MNTADLPPSKAQLTDLKGDVMATIRQVSKRQRRTRTALAAVAATLVVGGVATAGGYAYLDSITIRNTSYECYTTADANQPDSSGVQRYDKSPRTDTGLLPVEERVSDALRMCGLVYQGAGTNQAVEVPNPTACLLRDGRIGVFPNQDRATTEQFCQRLGLAVPS